MPARIAIVEDNTGIRTAWARLLDAQPGLRCTGVFGTGEAALAALPALQPEVVLMDINLPGISGIECTARLKPILPKTAILMVTVHSDSERVFQALQAGASGYLLKRTSSAELVAAIQDVLRGGAPMTSEIARKVIESFRQAALAPTPQLALTARENEILALLSQGYANKEIAERVSISFDTVRTHLRHIYEKLHVRSRTEAAAHYLQAPGRARVGSTPA